MDKRGGLLRPVGRDHEETEVISTRALWMHMGRVLEMAESSKTKEQYEAKIVDRFGGQRELDLGGEQA